MLPFIHKTLEAQVSLINWTSHPGCRVSARKQRHKRRGLLMRESTKEKMKSTKAIREKRGAKKAKELGYKVERIRAESTECEM